MTVLLPTYLASVFQHKTTVFLMTLSTPRYSARLLAYRAGSIMAILTASTVPHRALHCRWLFPGGAWAGLSERKKYVTSNAFASPAPGYGCPLRVWAGHVLRYRHHLLRSSFGGRLDPERDPRLPVPRGLNTLSYVLGMVAPLFLLALLLDRRAVQRKILMLRRPLSRNVLGHAISVTLPTLVAGLCFLVLGIAIVYLAVTKQLTLHSSYQIELNIGIFRFTAFVDKSLKVVPYQVSAFVVIALFACIFHRGTENCAGC